MIEDMKIISRTNNEVSFPNTTWDRMNKIYITGILNLGLSDRVHFNQHNCPTLENVIKLIHHIRYDKKSEFEFPCKEGRIKVEIVGGSKYRIYKYNLNGTIKLVTEKEHYSLPGTSAMLKSIWTQIEPLNRELRNKIAHKIQESEEVRQNENGLRLGDKVRTNELVKNERQGVISWIEYHNKDKKTYTYIMVDGVQHNRRYETNELELNEIRQITQHDDRITPTS